MSLLLAPFVVWLALAAILFFSQRRMLYPGRWAPRELVSGFRRAQLNTLPVPGGSVEVWWLPPAPGTPRPAPAVLFFHGNFELVDEWIDRFEPLRNAGVGVMLLEYPGYGRSTGTATQATVAELAVGVWDLAAAKRGEVDPARIVALGRSIGGGPAAALSLRRPLAALVLSSTFTGIRAFAHRYGMPGFLVRHPWDNLSAVGVFRGPILVQHGTRDRTVPFAHGARLAGVASDARLLPYDCGHSDCPWEAMFDDVVEFLRSRGVLGNPSSARGVG